MVEGLDENDTQGLLDITEAVAKLNGSFRNNDKLSKPQAEPEETNSIVRKKFGSRLTEAAVVDGN